MILKVLRGHAPMMEIEIHLSVSDAQAIAEFPDGIASRSLIEDIRLAYRNETTTAETSAWASIPDKV